MYTFPVSRGLVTRVWVCEPRHVCTCAMGRGRVMSLMSKMRMPSIRSALTVSGTPCVPQSTRPLVASTETNSSWRYTETSFCAPGQTTPVTRVGRDGDAMFQIWNPLKLPWIR